MSTDILEPLSVMLIDDEPPALKRLGMMLSRFDALTVTDRFTDPVVAAVAIVASHPQVVFLDIQMPEIDGFELIQRVGLDRMPLTVFVTAYDEHAVRAFEAHAFDYLLKPVREDRLTSTVERLVQRVRGLYPRQQDDDVAALTERFAALLDSVQVDRVPSRFSVRVNGTVALIDTVDIDRVEVTDNTIVITSRRGTFRFRDTLNMVEKRLPSGQFVRIQRSVILNVARIREIQPWFHGDYVFVLEDGTKLTSGRTYREQLKRRFDLP